MKCENTTPQWIVEMKERLRQEKLRMERSREFARLPDSNRDTESREQLKERIARDR